MISTPGFGIDGRASQFTHFVVVSPLSMPLEKKMFFLFKLVPGRGPERREPNEAVLCQLIIIILISYYYILLLNY